MIVVPSRARRVDVAVHHQRVHEPRGPADDDAVPLVVAQALRGDIVLNKQCNNK